ncbi:hypothetical protein HLH26_19865 [Gluconacetobacter sp. 1b LMG 1731]|uniref:HEPN domain-containing protein n=1 Tax=Gluconacetobacter dulcium TaxID=2729096 RepID=A0A7W4IPL6_9PROT|nr:hypothetical protein [Gluconacetobacter dulcium]MBB2166731.1 hypothetical protein [Gluconacetobacter dulcium]MBB2195833.1 hypothetical protein [Gluconacetobacter dulcium]
MTDPRECLEAAESIVLRNPACTGAEYRGAIHLAYYAVYHLVAGHMGQPTLGDKAVKHRNIVSLLRNSANIDPLIYEAKRNYAKIMTLRFRSDYDFSIDIGIDEANDAVDWAYEIFDAKSV